MLANHRNLLHDSEVSKVVRSKGNDGCQGVRAEKMGPFLFD